MISSEFIYLSFLGSKDLFLKLLAKFFKYFTFCLDRPALFNLAVESSDIFLGLILFLHIFLNLNQMASAAFVEICYEQHILAKLINGVFLVPKEVRGYFFINFLNTGSLLDNIFLAFFQ